MKHSKSHGVVEVALQVCLVCLVIMTHIKDGCEQPMKEYSLCRVL